MFFKNKGQISLKNEELNEILFFWTKKNIKVKLIESYNPRQRYQNVIVLLNFVLDKFKYIFTMMDHFTNYEWVIPLNENKTETILTA